MEDINNDELDLIPMPSSNSSSLEQTNASENSTEVMESWKRAQNALNSMGGGRSTFLPHPQNVMSFRNVPQPYYHNYPVGYNNFNLVSNMSYSSSTFQPNAFNQNYSMQSKCYPQLISSSTNSNEMVPPPATTKKVFPNVKPVRFLISRNKNSESQGQLSSNGGIPYPPAVKDYIERAYAATEECDRGRLEKFLKDRVEPLLRSGAVYAVNWAAEPLPHELNFQIHLNWTPASELKKQNQTLNLNKRLSTDQQVPHQNKFFNLNENEKNLTNLQEYSPNSPNFKSNEATFSINNNKNSKITKKKKKNKRQNTTLANSVMKVCSENWAVVDTSNKKECRAKRFASDKNLQQRQVSQNRNDFFVDIRTINDSEEIFNVVGTCMEVEKAFFRLTAAPDPNQVRPYRVLLEALELVKKKYKIERNYRYVCDQLKSIRQDLMIQNIRNEFTILVYESNARIALENKDREEFNQCQNQLKELYAECPNLGNKWEFTSYRLLYYIYMKDILDVSSLLDELLPEALNDPCMNFALSVWDTWSMSNYVQLFRLYCETPKMTGYVMDLFVERERKAFLSSILKAYRPEIPIKQVADWLIFSEKELTEWLAQYKIIANVGGQLDCRRYANVTL